MRNYWCSISRILLHHEIIKQMNYSRLLIIWINYSTFIYITDPVNINKVINWNVITSTSWSWERKNNLDGTKWNQLFKIEVLAWWCHHHETTIALVTIKSRYLLIQRTEPHRRNYRQTETHRSPISKVTIPHLLSLCFSHFLFDQNKPSCFRNLYCSLISFILWIW